MYGNPYYNSYNPQNTIDRINAQISELEKMKTQFQQPIPQPTSLTQNFQLAPTNNSQNMKFANSINEVEKEVVIGNTPFFSKDMSIVWVKNSNNEIKTYELNEIIAKDDKDIKIDFLMAQIEALKQEVNKNEHITNVNEPITNTVKSEEPTNVSTISKSSKKSK